MEITKVVKPFIRRGANTFGNMVYLKTIQANRNDKDNNNYKKQQSEFPLDNNTISF